MTVSKNEHGADLVDKDGNSYELKVSSCVKRNGYKCNFNWPIPSGKDEHQRRLKLLTSVIEKTGGNSYANFERYSMYSHTDPHNNKLAGTEENGGRGGGFKMIARDATTQLTLKEYFLSGVFVYHYFKRLPCFPTSTTYNFGCERCSNLKCLEYHRLQRLEDYDKEMLAQMNQFFFFKRLTYLDDVPFLRWSSSMEEDACMDLWVPWKEVFTKIPSTCGKR
jgi:hypothetical protein